MSQRAKKHHLNSLQGNGQRSSLKVVLAAPHAPVSGTSTATRDVLMQANLQIVSCIPTCSHGQWLTGLECRCSLAKGFISKGFFILGIVDMVYDNLDI